MPADRRPFLTALPALSLSAAMIAVLAIAFPGLHGPLVLDSSKLYALQDLVTRYGNRAVFHTPGFNGELRRIVSMASFVLNLELAGRLSPFQLKLTNVFIHLAAGGLVFILTRQILRQTAHREMATTAAVGTSALWLLAPVNVNVVFYTVQRMAQLSALFTLAGLVLYTAGRLQDRIGPRVLCIASSILLCLPLAVLSKENGVLLPALAFLVEIYFLHPVHPWIGGRQLALIAALCAAAAIALLIHLYPGVLSYRHRDFTLGQRLLTEPRALMSYLRHIVLPHGADIGVYSDDFALSTSVLTPASTLPALLGCAAMATLCVIYRRGRWAPIAFGAAFFLVGHLVESTFIPLEPYFLHRNYLPSYGIYFALACLPVLVAPGRQGRKWMILLLAIYSTYFAAISYARSETWSSRVNIVSSAVHYHPRSPRALSNFAQLALDRGHIDLATSAIDRAVALAGTPAPRLQKIYILCRAGANISSSEYADLAGVRAFGVANELSQALGNLLALYREGGCRGLRIAPLVDALDKLAVRYARSGGDPWTVEYYADSFLYHSGNRSLALQRLQTRLDAGRPEAGLYRLHLLIEQGDKRKAEATLEQITSELPAKRLRPFKRSLDDLRQQLGKL